MNQLERETARDRRARIVANVIELLDWRWEIARDMTPASRDELHREAEWQWREAGRTDALLLDGLSYLVEDLVGMVAGLVPPTKSRRESAAAAGAIPADRRRRRAARAAQLAAERMPPKQIAQTIATEEGHPSEPFDVGTVRRWLGRRAGNASG